MTAGYVPPVKRGIAVNTPSQKPLYNQLYHFIITFTICYFNQIVTHLYSFFNKNAFFRFYSDGNNAYNEVILSLPFVHI